MRIIKSIFETWVRLGLLDSTMFSLLFLSLNPAMHEISLFACFQNNDTICCEHKNNKKYF
jgi:hypothetical protein